MFGKRLIGLGGNVGNTEMQVSTARYNGNGTSQDILTGFQSDFSWFKQYDSTGCNFITDSLRGVNSQLSTNNGNSQTTDSQMVTAYNSTSVSIGSNSNINQSGISHFMLNIAAGNKEVNNNDGTILSVVNAVPGFSVVKYTGTGTAGTVGHAMGLTPSMVIIKRIDANTSFRGWNVFYNYGGQKRIVLNTTAASAGSLYALQSVSDTTFQTPAYSHSDWNVSGGQYVAYCFADEPNHCKVGYYAGQEYGAIGVSLLSPPKFLMVKNMDYPTDWKMFSNVMETARSLEPNTCDTRLNSFYGCYASFSGNNVYINSQGQGIEVKQVGYNYMYLLIG